MKELFVPSIEDAVIRVCTTEEPISRVVVDTSDSTFLAYNTVHGYSQVDFKRPDNGKLQELAALLELHFDFRRSNRFYTGLYLDMLALAAPGARVTFTGDERARPSRFWGGADSSEPAPRSRGWLEARGFRDVPSPQARHGQAAPATLAPAPPGSATGGSVRRASSGPGLLATFGDSYAYGEEIDTIELGYKNDRYRVERSYSYIMARELRMQYAGNFAEPGGSNPLIIRRVVDFVNARRDELQRCFIVVGLTHPGRKAFVRRDGSEFKFVSDKNCAPPRVMAPLLIELFHPMRPDGRMNQEIEHKYWVLHSFLRKMGCRFLIYPCWDFSCSDAYFRDRDLGLEAAFYFGPRRTFGFGNSVSHLPTGKWYHPLSEGHALFAAELLRAVRGRGLV